MLICVMLIVWSWTALYAQTGNWYSEDECRRIASRLIRANECDTLLRLAYADIDTYADMVVNLENVVMLIDSVITLKTREIKVCSDEMDKLNRECEKCNKRKKISNIAWGATTGIIAIVLMVVLLL